MSLVLQEKFFLANNECTWVKTATTEITSKIELSYQVPIMGYIALWLSEAAAIHPVNNQAEVKEHWLVPVASLLEVAKVASRSCTISFKSQSICINLQASKASFLMHGCELLKPNMNS